jgi:hypothetical protein
MNKILEFQSSNKFVWLPLSQNNSIVRFLFFSKVGYVNWIFASRNARFGDTICRLPDYCHVWGAKKFVKYEYFGHGGLTQMVLAGNTVLFDLLKACRSGSLWWMVSLVFVPFCAILEFIIQGIDPYIIIYTSISRICWEVHWTFIRRHITRTWDLLFKWCQYLLNNWIFCYTLQSYRIAFHGHIMLC